MKSLSRISLLLAVWILFLTPTSTLAGSVQYTHDEVGRIKSAQYDDGTVVEYTYDAAGNVLTETVTVADSDSDGLPDDLEESTCTDPKNADTDGDGIADGIEDANHDGAINPLAGETDPCDADTDDDGLLDGEEDKNQDGDIDPGETDPNNPDSDGDGYTDGDEVEEGSDPNDPESIPTEAVDDDYSTDEDVELIIAAPGVLGNDLDANNEPLHAVVRSNPGHGSLLLNDDGGFSYTPGPDFNGTDSFSYTASAGDAFADDAMVTITINPINDPPVAEPESYAVDEGATLAPADGVLANDTDVDGDALAATLGVEPAHAVSFNLNSDGTFTYVHDGSETTSDTFIYVVSDGEGSEDDAMVQITIYPVNDPPLGTTASITTDEDTTSVAVTPSVIDPDVGDSHVFAIVAQPSNGTASVVENRLVYEPHPDFNGTDAFTYCATDTGGLTVDGTALVTVNPVNDPPIISVDRTEQALQYSDGILPCTISISDIDSTELSISTSWQENGGPVQDGLPNGCMLDTEGPCTGVLPLSCTRVLSGAMLGGAGTYDVTITLDDGEESVSAATTMEVDVEDARAVFDAENPVAVRVAAPGGDSGIFELVTHIREVLPDEANGEPYAGDIALSEVSMSLIPVGPGNPMTGTCTPGQAVGNGYDATLPVACAFDGVPVNTYSAEVSIDGDYYAGATEDVLTVYDPSLGFATGGGWFSWPETGEKTNLGFTMKYNKKGANLSGNLLLIRHRDDGTIYRVKSNALEGLALSPMESPFGYASFSGKATYKSWDWEEPVGNHGFVVYVEDYGEPGGNDRFWIRVLDKDRVTVGELSMEEQAADNAVTLQRGNIVVPHTPGGGQ